MIFRFTLNSDQYGAYVLPEEPDGWKDIEILFKRSLQYHGIFNEAMAQLNFTCRAGKEYIDRALEEQGVDCVINILIQMSCVTGHGGVEAPDYSIDYSDDYGSMAQGSGSPIFETLYEGVLDLSSYVQERNYTTVSLIQSDFVQKVLNRFETVVDIDSNKDVEGNIISSTINQPYIINIPGKAIRYATKLKLDTALQENPFVFSGSGPYQFIYIYHPYVAIYDDLGYSAYQPIVDYNNSLTYHPEGAMSAPFSGTYEISYDLSGSILFQNNDNSARTLSYSLRYGIGQTRQAATQIGANFGGIVNANSSRIDPFSFSGSISVHLNEGDVFQFYIAIRGVPDPNSVLGLFDGSILLQYTTANFEIHTDTIFDSSTSNAYLVHEAGASISQRITGQEDAFRSTLLGRKNSLPVSYNSNGCFSFASLTTGRKIRNFTQDAGNNFFISMDDFYKSINSYANIGIGFEKIDNEYKIVLEEKSFFYKNYTILQLKNATIKRSIAKEFYVSDIFIGFDKWENEEVNGIDEFNSKRQYSTGIKSISNNIDLISPIIGSAYAIEFTRRKQYVDFPSLDWKYDSDNFIFMLKRDVDGSGIPNKLNEVEQDENFDQIINVFSPESNYNYRISPARNIIRHLSVIGCSLIKYTSRLLKFSYGEGNYLMQTEMKPETCQGDFNGNLLAENQDIPWQEGEDPIWIPEYLEFDYPLKFSEYLTLKADPKGCIEVSESDGDFMKGFIVELRYKPVIGMCYFKLLRAYDGN